jgi:hypothetical protein
MPASGAGSHQPVEAAGGAGSPFRRPVRQWPEIEQIMRRLTLPTIALLLVGASAATAAPRPTTIEVRLRVAEGYYPKADSTRSLFYASEPCAVRVPAKRANGYEALVAGRGNRCISSFAATRSTAGHYLTCVNGRCEDTGFYWAIYQNGALACTGMDELALKPGDEVAFSWESYPTALALAACEA